MGLLNRYGFLLVIGIAWSCGGSWVHAQTATLRGFVTAVSDGQPLPGVNVIVTNRAGNRYGAASDNDGFYAISRVPAGFYRVRATFIGFAPLEDSLSLASGQILTRNLSLRISQTQLDEVVVESKRETAGAANITAGLQTVRPVDIDLVPAPDVSADLVNYLSALPGVVSQGDQGGQLFIRGGEPTQNLVLLDGMMIYQPFHILGFFSAFPSDIINTADVYAGGYGAKYGGRLSSVIDVTARTGNKQRWGAGFSAAPFVSAARIEGPIVPGKVSLLASARESVIDQGASRLINDPLPFDFGDAFGKLHANLSAGAQLSITGLHTHDRGQLGLDPLQPDPEAQDEVSWTNDAVGGRLIFLPANLPIFAEFLVSGSSLRNEIGPAGTSQRSTAVDRFSFAANLTHYLGNLDVNWGIFLNSLTLESQLGGQFQNISLQGESVTEAGIYFEPKYRLGGLKVIPSLRIHAFPSKSETFVEPRFRAVWNVGPQRFSLAAGIYHQEVTGLTDRRNAGDVFTAWTTSPLAQVPEAKHLLAGWRIQPTRWLNFSLEGFYKDLKDVVIPEWTSFPRFTTNLQSADGTAYGTDVRLEVTASPFYGMINYGYSKVEYNADIPALTLLTGEAKTTYDPPHDRRHQANALIGFSVAGFNLNVHWQFGSGLPFNQSIGFDQFILLDSLVNVSEEPGQQRVLYKRPYTGRLPAYHRLDLSLDRTFHLQNHAMLTAQVGIINVYDRRNLFYFDLFTLRRVDQLPLLPTFGLKLDFN